MHPRQTICDWPDGYRLRNDEIYILLYPVGHSQDSLGRAHVVFFFKFFQGNAKPDILIATSEKNRNVSILRTIPAITGQFLARQVLTGFLWPPNDNASIEVLKDWLHSEKKLILYSVYSINFSVLYCNGTRYTPIGNQFFYSSTYSSDRRHDRIAKASGQQVGEPAKRAGLTSLRRQTGSFLCKRRSNVATGSSFLIQLSYQKDLKLSPKSRNIALTLFGTSLSQPSSPVCLSIALTRTVFPLRQPSSSRAAILHRPSTALLLLSYLSL